MEGVEVIFGYPGGAILPVYDPIIDSKIRHVLVRHEQGAGHAAEGYAHATGKPGVCMVTSGPAATNIVTPLADAYLDSVPVVCITGQVALPAIGTDAFQECDTTGITRSITKHNMLVTRAEDIPMAIKEAFHIATTGRPGPVLVDVPKDIVDANNPAAYFDFVYPTEVDLPGYSPVSTPDAEAIEEAVALIQAAERPSDRAHLIGLFDHEECGSMSTQGAQGTFLVDVMRRLAEGHPERSSEGHEASARAAARSLLVSADMAHAMHPGYPEMYEPGNHPYLNRGPAIKRNVNQRYATDGETGAWFAEYCRAAGFEPQHYVHRTGLRCGSTIGALTAAGSGIRTVDVGNPMLAMHSVRETAGALDPDLMIEALLHHFS